MGVVSASIVDPVLQLLKSLHLDIQQEGIYHVLNDDIKGITRINTDSVLGQELTLTWDWKSTLTWDKN